MNRAMLRHKRPRLDCWLLSGDQQIGSKYQVWGKGDRFYFRSIAQPCDALFAETVELPEWVPREVVYETCRQYGQNGFSIKVGRSSLYKDGENELLLVWEVVLEDDIPSFDDLVAGEEGSSVET